SLSIPDSVDVSGSVVVTSVTYDTFCDPAARHLRRHVLVHGARATTLADEPATAAAAPGDVRVAGRFAAWSEVGGRRIVVYDMRARRNAHRVEVAGEDVAFEVPDDSNLAIPHKLVSVPESAREWRVQGN